jgi:hypothetical protein
MREHARLEMPAIQAPGILARAHQPLPLLGGERQIQWLAVGVVGEPIAGQMLVGERVLKRFQHRTVGARRLKLDRAREREHRRAVAADLPVDQRHVVVRMMRRDRLDVLKLGVESAGALDRRSGRRERPLSISASRPARVKMTEQLPVVLDQPLGDLPPLLADLLKLGLRPLRDHRHPLAEHVRQLIPSPSPSDVHQARKQRGALGLGHIAYHRRVSSVRLAGEVSDLRLRDPLKPSG